MSLGTIRIIGTNTDPGATSEVLGNSLSIISTQDLEVARVNPYPQLGNDPKTGAGGVLIQDRSLQRSYSIEVMPLLFEQATFTILDNIESVLACHFVCLENIDYPIKLHEPDYVVQVVAELEVVEGTGEVKITLNCKRRFPLV